jgi:hypothetical protein
MVGQAWQTNLAATAQTSNAFAIKLAGAAAVTLDARRMRLDGTHRLTGDVASTAPLALRLQGRWPGRLIATLDGTPVALQRNGALIEIELPAGQHRLVLAPAAPGATIRRPWTTRSRASQRQNARG